MERMRQLTYHHILEKRNGGKATVENGALLSAENHSWFNQQSPAKQRAMNEAFQTYNKTVNVAIMQGTNIEARQLEFDMSDCIEIPLTDNRKYNRAKVKKEWEKKAKEELEDYYR